MKKHRTDVVSLVFALVFLAISVWWLLAHLFDPRLPSIGWFLASALILLGVLGLVGALRSGREPTPTTDAPAGSGAAEHTDDDHVPSPYGG
jgi:hypothetical protein